MDGMKAAAVMELSLASRLVRFWGRLYVLLWVPRLASLGLKSPGKKQRVLDFANAKDWKVGRVTYVGVNTRTV